MPRSLCAAKREIKEAVISSAASAADSCIAVAERVCEAVRGAKACKGKKNMEAGMGRKRRRTGQQTVGSAFCYKVLQLSGAPWRENTRRRWGCDELRGATGRGGVKATMNFEQNQSGLVVWLKYCCNCSDCPGRGMKKQTATADYVIILSDSFMLATFVHVQLGFVKNKINKNNLSKQTFSHDSSQRGCLLNLRAVQNAKRIKAGAFTVVLHNEFVTTSLQGSRCLQHNTPENSYLFGKKVCAWYN